MSELALCVINTGDADSSEVDSIELWFGLGENP